MPHTAPGHRPRVRALAALAITSALLGTGATAAQAADPATSAEPAVRAAAAASPYERGVAPSNASIEATSGPFATATTTVSRSSVTGFGGGTIYYPTSTTDGTFGAVAISPGFLGTQRSIAWYGPLIASQGFVVMTIETLAGIDQPDSRGNQLLAALKYLTDTSTVRTQIDATRLGVMGHSMGGGGSLAAALKRPTLQAVVALTPWHGTKSWASMQVPTLIIGAEADNTASVTQHAEPFYNSIPATENKAYLELDGAVHNAPATANVTIAKYTISWLKRFIDDDTRYEQFLCPAPLGTAIQEYRDTCPHS